MQLFSLGLTQSEKVSYTSCFFFDLKIIQFLLRNPEGLSSGINFMIKSQLKLFKFQGYFDFDPGL